MSNQSLCMSCRYGSSCADYIADKDAFVVRCDKYQKLITHADKIRSMTDEELADLLTAVAKKSAEMLCENIKTVEVDLSKCDFEILTRSHLSWLKSPAEEVNAHA